MTTEEIQRRAQAAQSGAPYFEDVELSWFDDKEWPNNPKGHDLGFLAEAFETNGLAEFPTFDEGTGRMVAGHGRVKQLRAMHEAGEPPPERVKVEKGKWLVPVIRGMTFKAPEKHVVASNRGVELGGWDNQLLRGLLEQIGEANLAGTGFGQDDLAGLLAGPTREHPKLADRFGVPPFSVLDARQGYWQDRKRQWLAIGIQSELGRAAPIGGAPMPMDRERERESVQSNHGARDSHAQAHGSVRARRPAPGGSPRPAMKLVNGKTVRGDGRGRPL